MKRATLRTILTAIILGAGAWPAPVAVGGDVVYQPIPGRDGLPFSESVRVGELVFLSGQIGVVWDSGASGTAGLALAPGGIEAETRQIFANMTAALARQGLTPEDLVKCTAMLADIGEWPTFNTVYSSYFESNLPARSAMGVSGLALGARVELECIAAGPAPAVETATEGAGATERSSE